MSWSVSATIKGDSPEDGLDGLRKDALAQNPEAGDQFEAAKDAAYALIASGSCGGPERWFHVIMAGHGNLEHKSRAGWANDTITVTVTQA